MTAQSNDEPRSASATRPARIAVVERNAAYRRLLVSTLRSQGYDVVGADDEPALAGHDVDLIIADAARLPAIDRTDGTPLILMSSRLCKQNQRMAQQADAAAVVHRPIFFDEFRAAVATQLASRKHPRPRRTSVRLRTTRGRAAISV